MRKALASITLASSICLSAPASAESRFADFLSGSFFEGENWSAEVMSAAISVATEKALAGLFEQDPATDTPATDPADPLEKYNRMMFEFNAKLDDAALKPLAEYYAEYTPEIVRTGVRNFFSNINDVGVAANSALQGKVDQALSDSSRLALNSVVGLGGVIDVASELDIEKNDEDFGQTLGVWGVPEGPYIVLPILGPRTLRSAVGTALDTYLQVETLGSVAELGGAESAVSELMALNVVDQRTRLLGKESLLDTAALDPYIFARESYLAYRRCKVADCDKIDYIPAAPEGESDSNLFEGNSFDGNSYNELEMLDELDQLDELDLLND